MKLSKQQNVRIHDKPAEIVLYHLQNIKISEESFVRFGDRNKITKGLRTLYLTNKNGYPLDKFAKNYLEDLSNLDEKDKIEIVIDTMIKFDSKSKIDDYFKKNKEPKISKNKVKMVNLEQAKPCLVKASLQHMSKDQLRVELKDLIKSPKSYFGKLLEVNECKVDLFTVNDKQQIKLAKKMLVQLDKENDKPKSKISLGVQKPLKLEYGNLLKTQSGYKNINSNSQKETKTMAKAKTTAKKSTAKKSTAKKKTGSTRKQYEAQAYIGRLSKEATKIQEAGGKKTIPAKQVYKVNRADAVKKAAKTVK